MKRALLLVLFFVSTPAFARSYNLAKARPITFAFRGGITANPRSDFTTSPRSAERSFSHFVTFEPAIDGGNVVLRFSMAYNFHPLLSGSGASFKETSKSNTTIYGAHLLLSPWMSEEATSRFYFELGYGLATHKATNTRTYSGGTAHSEQVKGTGKEMVTGLGYESMFVQNYSLQFSAGYRQLTFKEFDYISTTDTRGEARAAGERVKDEFNSLKRVKLDGYYVSLGLALHF